MGEKGMCVGCMSRMCGSVSGALVLVAGLMFLLMSQAMLDVMTAHLIAGLALGLYGLGLLAHVLNMCPMCKG